MSPDNPGSQDKRSCSSATSVKTYLPGKAGGPAADKQYSASHPLMNNIQLAEDSESEPACRHHKLMVWRERLV